VLTAGPVVKALSHSFDAYWNSDLAYPLDAFGPIPPHPPPDPEHASAPASKPADPTPAVAAIRQAVATCKFDFVWAPARALSDPPLKVSPEMDGETRSISEDVLQIIGHAQKEVLIVSPYFIPGDAVMKVFADLRQRGVVIRVLTNSLATNDVPPAHAGYARRREQLLRMGIQLYELKPSPPEVQVAVFGDIARSKASLHGKSMVVDRHIAFVGSMNIDPRSQHLDTENGVIVASTTLSSQLVAIFEKGMSPEAAYRVELDGDSLQWITRDGNAERRFDSEPDTTVLYRLYADLLMMTAPENQL
jgi:phosphatidylserine/phosphatidylglycerophosphate/cardiolipin synthase-like enzyme